MPAATLTSAATSASSIRSGCLVAVVLLAASLPVAAQRGPQRHARLTLADSLAVWYALGIDAHHLCAGLWVVGRDHERPAASVIAQDIARFPAFRWERTFGYTIDESRRTATVRDPRVGSRSAKYSGDQGCAILPAGSGDVYFEPEIVKGRLPDVATQEWPSGDHNATARFADVDHDALEATLDWAFDEAAYTPAQNTRGIVVAYRGRIVAERYAPGWTAHTPQISWSAGKSIAATLIGVLVQQGRLRLDEPAPVPEWQHPRDPRRAIRIADLLHMSSGLDFDNFGLNPAQSYTAANEHFRIYFDALDVAAHAINQPLRFAPGTVWRYRNSDPLTLMRIARSIVESDGGDALAFPYHLLFDRIGIRNAVLETDAWGNFVITGFDFMSTRDWARLGLLYLHDGVWGGERILPEGFAKFVATPAPADRSRSYGGLFWLNRGGAMPRLPADAYWAAGYMGQYAMVIPSRDLVVVRQGPSRGGDRRYFEELVARILKALPPPAAGTPPAVQSPAGTVIVTNMSDATATLIDGATRQVVATLPTGPGPHEVATSADGRWAVATSYGDRDHIGNTLTLIDVAGRKVARTIDVSPHRRPHSATFLPGDSLLAVTSETSQAILIIDVASGTVRRTISTTQPASHMLAVTADGRRGFTSNVSAGTISLLDMVSGAAETMPVAPAVEGIGVRPSGDQVWVGSNKNRTVSIVDVGRKAIVDSLVAFGMPYRIAFTPDGRMAIITDPVKAEIRFIEASTRREIDRLALPPDGVVGTAEVPGSASPEGLTVSPDGRWAFVTLQGCNEVAFIDLRTRKVVARAPTGVWPDGVGFARPIAPAR